MTSTPDLPPLLAMRGIVKRFPGVTALSGVSLSLCAGEVLALVGENGAGKSTLMKILGGACPPGEGQIFLDGSPVSLSGVRAAKRLGRADPSGADASSRGPRRRTTGSSP
ncbi:ATP-binding cassette domain-containing protein [Sorangium sp. So ce302]|uniref:ATP-binding cassette domain-containing protein n=1 Tax=unclassified Sorangium TaxID=2621164 RepID=UPI003F63A241